ncbi:Type I restriction-modification system, DNA-methyltransferase subunit M [Corynebacterium pseudotuberculosis]|nr:Type I restriction-modification system, DNA-methyltransferase subunit M [Corynebacterium pseudotuberculosis]
MKRFVDDAGQKVGEFFTPRSVVHLITRLLKPQENETVYDPTCSTGGMLFEPVAAVDANGGDTRT